MSTPNQPNDEGRSGTRPEPNPSAETAQVKPVGPGTPPEAGAAKESGSEQGLFSEQSLPPLPVREPAQAEPPGVPVPPWQRGGQSGQAQSGGQPGQAPMQQEPQSSLGRPGHSPVASRQPGPPPGGPLPTVGTAAPARSVSDLAAKAARKEAAMVKSVGIDGPTRSIARPELAKDMPDLSDLRHPLPAPAPEPGAAPAGGYSGGAQPQRVIVADPQVAAAVASGEPLRATVQIRRIDPWTALKVSLVISLALFFIWMIAIGLLYLVLAGMGVWDRLNSTFTDMMTESSSDGLISSGDVFWYAGMIGLVNVVLLTALATIGTFIYNQCAELVGGVQVTLADPD